MKTAFCILLSLTALHLHAQDVIVKKDGSTILAKVLEVDETNIKYKKHSNQSGPTYTISVGNVMAINYKNGEKDTFGDNTSSTISTNTTTNNKSSQRLVKKSADSRNSEIISRYNQIYETHGIAEKKSAALECFVIFGVKSSSVMSNDDIEMTFVRDEAREPRYNSSKYTIYLINLKNKTDKTIYIDKGNCFRIIHDGTFYCYYENTEQTTVNLGGGSGGTLGLGSVAGVLGVGGAVGQLASGIAVGGGSSHSVSTTYLQQRVIAIPPHGNRNLTEEKWVQTKNGNLLSSAEYTTVENAEFFNIISGASTTIKRGDIKRGEVRVFAENELPWKREYIITYSTEEDFATYSTINAELYIHEMIGRSTWDYNSDKHIAGINEYTIEGWCGLNKKY